MKAKMTVLYHESVCDNDPEWNLISVTVRQWSQPETRYHDVVMDVTYLQDGETWVSDRKVLPRHMTSAQHIRMGVEQFDDFLHYPLKYRPEDNNSLGSGQC